MIYKGIDVSKWQPKIDWTKVKASGITFAILRASYSTTTDSKFKTHIKDALAEGINVGVYCYSTATTVLEAVEEADHILELVRPYKLSYPIFYDLESTQLQALDNQKRTDIAIAFCDRIERAGYYVSIYANKNWLENMLDYNRLRPYDVWLAQWTTEPTWKGTFGMWQYGLGYVDGIGDCDCDISYRDYPSIIAKFGLNNAKSATISIGSKVKYSGKVHSSSWGIGRKIDVNGTFTVKQVIPNRKYGIQINGLGWVAEQDCTLV